MPLGKKEWFCPSMRASTGEKSNSTRRNRKGLWGSMGGVDNLGIVDWVCLLSSYSRLPAVPTHLLLSALVYSALVCDVLPPLTSFALVFSVLWSPLACSPQYIYYFIQSNPLANPGSFRIFSHSSTLVRSLFSKQNDRMPKSTQCKQDYENHKAKNSYWRWMAEAIAKALLAAAVVTISYKVYLDRHNFIGERQSFYRSSLARQRSLFRYLLEKCILHDLTR